MDKVKIPSDLPQDPAKDGPNRAHDWQPTQTSGWSHCRTCGHFEWTDRDLRRALFIKCGTNPDAWPPPLPRGCAIPTNKKEQTCAP